MANTKNLIDNSKLTPSERRERASIAGKASGEARRARQAVRRVANEIVCGKYQVDGETLGGDEVIAKKLLEVLMDVNHRDWYKVLELVLRLTDSDISEAELEVREAKMSYALKQAAYNDESFDKQKEREEAFERGIYGF